ncbi:AI-2E family transporter [Wenyingzhuangia aestuarii]|uniref:AI-2E family transporter n=1 Tax=Wenyingzhuangia aestuarii TaxID=1647582 RepID=UPI00143C4555|nr:AI-2E family transporter [Wenyingzhuangia aestuarii]NJB82688.1 putative PurR-regulated permease PerM [Wenyingzhuangia aestuarii]
MKDTRTTNILLLIIVISLVFYLLQTLSFIFIPLVLAMFIALLFLPLMRWFNKKSIPKFVSIPVVVLIIAGVFRVGGVLIQLSSNEILEANGSFFEKAETKIVDLIILIENYFGVVRVEGDSLMNHYLQGNNLAGKIGPSLDFVGDVISMSLMTLFFAILLLAGSINVEKLLNSTIFKQKHASVKTFRKIEKDIITFVKVKFIISLFTGIGFGLACVFFDVSFPIFWGLLAFLLNFIQMIGSIVSIALLALFALVEIDVMSTLLFFVITITGVQVVLGSVLEPIFMGKTFSINVITILVMLMFWGFIWGIPGLILSIPITVIVKIILDQFPKYQVISSLMSGKDS